jgi:hypothetical protein
VGPPRRRSTPSAPSPWASGPDGPRAAVATDRRNAEGTAVTVDHDVHEVRIVKRDRGSSEGFVIDTGYSRGDCFWKANKSQYKKAAVYALSNGLDKPNDADRSSIRALRRRRIPPYNLNLIVVPQFEREITGERIRDKIAAWRREIRPFCRTGPPLHCRGIFSHETVPFGRRDGRAA